MSANASELTITFRKVTADELVEKTFDEARDYFEEITDGKYGRQGFESGDCFVIPLGTWQDFAGAFAEACAAMDRKRE